MKTGTEFATTLHNKNPCLIIHPMTPVFSRDASEIWAYFKVTVQTDQRIIFWNTITDFLVKDPFAMPSLDGSPIRPREHDIHYEAGIWKAGSRTVQEDFLHSEMFSIAGNHGVFAKLRALDVLNDDSTFLHRMQAEYRIPAAALQKTFARMRKEMIADEIARLQ